MAWFTLDTIEFLRELALNNDREWFAANKKRYEKSVKGPMLEFAGEMIERMRALQPGITMLPKDSVFRIHRDTRFSKDKSPYKTHAALVVTEGRRGDHSSPGLYFHLDGEHLAIASGLYMLEPADLQRVRMHIASNLEEFDRLLHDPEFVRWFGEIEGAKNKIIPAELREAAEKQPLIFNKQFFYWKQHPAQEALRDDLPDFVMSHIRAGWPMTQFLRQEP